MTKSTRTAMASGLIGCLLAGGAGAATLQLLSQAKWRTNPGDLVPEYGNLNTVDPEVNPIVKFEVAVSLSEEGNHGLSQVVYDIRCQEAIDRGYVLNEMVRSYSGYRNFGSHAGQPETIAAPAYDSPQPTPPPANYGGGWGFDGGSGLPTGGTVTALPGAIIGAGVTVFLTWSGDNAPHIDGLQSLCRLGVGHGTHMLSPDDGVFPNAVAGFGSDLLNGRLSGTGEWVYQGSYVDVSNWEPGTYHFNVVPVAANSYRVTDAEGNEIDYYQPLGGGFRQAISEDNGDTLLGSTFEFTIVPPYPTCGDLDGDHDVDLADFGAFALCFELTAPNESCPAETFAQADMNADGEVNRVDFSTFAVIFGTINIKAPPACLE